MGAGADPDAGRVPLAGLQVVERHPDLVVSRPLVRPCMPVVEHACAPHVVGVGCKMLRGQPAVALLVPFGLAEPAPAHDGGSTPPASDSSASCIAYRICRR